MACPMFMHVVFQSTHAWGWDGNGDRDVFVFPAIKGLCCVSIPHRSTTHFPFAKPTCSMVTSQSGGEGALQFKLFLVLLSLIFGSFPRDIIDTSPASEAIRALAAAAARTVSASRTAAVAWFEFRLSHQLHRIRSGKARRIALLARLPWVEPLIVDGPE